jgi:hypothetical protein
MKLKALKYMRYAGKPVQVGDVFDANAADVRILLALNRAVNYVEPPPKPAPAVFKPIPPYVASAAEVETAAKAEADSDADKPKRAYRRRDMTAE